MDWCGTEHTYALALTFLPFEPLGLDDDTQTLDEENATENWQQQFLMDDDCAYTDNAADRQRTCVAHKDLCRVGIIP